MVPDETKIKQDEVRGYGDVLAALRSLPNGEEIIADNFLYEDIDLAVEQFGQSQEWDTTIAMLKPEPGMMVLDYGAGRGLASFAFAQAGCKVVAIDINASQDAGLGMMRSAAIFQSYRQQIQPIVADGEYIAVQADRFDIVYCREALHHAFDLQKLTKNLIRVLKPGGIFYAYGDHRRPWWSSDEQFRQRHPAVPFGVNEHSYLESEYVRALRQAGLRKLAVKPIMRGQPQHRGHRIAVAMTQMPMLGSTLRALYARLLHYTSIGSQIIIVGRK
ncbi:class I SAM-dependent methyltransferase [Candidatus Chloroploca sp. Khr17]|uniref:class I SAM-dependent methyltransferase n=1 Tax=Candidatus Chloroploca sp. Khr17 TaxID=2496869 RepID=UPI0013ED5B33|nr:class I SAM-dependent methyltransferase [Candidatus Chloroploca sp. Khr17]